MPGQGPTQSLYQAATTTGKKLMLCMMQVVSAAACGYCMPFSGFALVCKRSCRLGATSKGALGNPDQT